MASLSFAFEMHISLLICSFVAWMRPQWMLRTENNPIPILLALFYIFYKAHFFLTLNKPSILYSNQLPNHEWPPTKVQLTERVSKYNHYSYAEKP